MSRLIFERVELLFLPPKKLETRNSKLETCFPFRNFAPEP